MKNKSEKHIHFIGIGGIGVSALAQYYISEKYRVSGTDVEETDIIEMLKRQGALILKSPPVGGPASGLAKSKSQTKDYIKGSEVVVYSVAVSKSDWQLEYAKKHSVKTVTYAEAVGELTQKYKTICVSGTHGKSTTTAMLSLVLIEAGIDPTVIVGTKMREFMNVSRYQVTASAPLPGSGGGCGTNFRKGEGDWLLLEADEFHANFLNYAPDIAVINNIEEDHLDFYKDLDDIISTFGRFVGNIKKGGALVINGDDKNIKRIFPPDGGSARGLTNFKFSARGRTRQRGGQISNLSDVDKLKEILKVSGKYNIYNALAALAVARVMGIKDEVSFEALSKFKGAWRRMESLGKYKEVEVFSDYAHHPTEIKAVLDSLTQDTMVIFQPHQYLRLEKLWDDFVKVFGEASKRCQMSNVKCQMLITDVYGVVGRNQRTNENISSKALVEEINKKYPEVGVEYIPKTELEMFVRNELQVSSSKFQEVVFMGAGDIDDVARGLVGGMD